MSLPNITVNVPTGQTKSGAAHVRGRAIVKIELPAALTSTSLTFEESEDNSTFKPVRNTSGVFTVTVAQNGVVHFDAMDLMGCEYLKVVCGSTETRVNGTDFKIFTAEGLS